MWPALRVRVRLGQAGRALTQKFGSNKFWVKASGSARPVIRAPRSQPLWSWSTEFLQQIPRPRVTSIVRREIKQNARRRAGGGRPPVPGTSLRGLLFSKSAAKGRLRPKAEALVFPILSMAKSKGKAVVYSFLHRIAYKFGPHLRTTLGNR